MRKENMPMIYSKLDLINTVIYSYNFFKVLELDKIELFSTETVRKTKKLVADIMEENNSQNFFESRYNLFHLSKLKSNLDNCCSEICSDAKSLRVTPEEFHRVLASEIIGEDNIIEDIGINTKSPELFFELTLNINSVDLSKSKKR